MALLIYPLFDFRRDILTMVKWVQIKGRNIEKTTINKEIRRLKSTVNAAYSVVEYYADIERNITDKFCDGWQKI